MNLQNKVRPSDSKQRRSQIHHKQQNRLPRPEQSHQKQNDLVRPHQFSTNSAVTSSSTLIKKHIFHDNQTRSNSAFSATNFTPSFGIRQCVIQPQYPSPRLSPTDACGFGGDCQNNMGFDEHLQETMYQFPAKINGNSEISIACPQTIQQNVPLPSKSAAENNDHMMRQQKANSLQFAQLSQEKSPKSRKYVRRNDSVSAMGNSDQHDVEQNSDLQTLLGKIRELKETNRRLCDDNQELRDLCCFLDDDRQKGRKLAREWQRFGRYTASVMRQEVSIYQNKLHLLDDKQQQLIKDNLELKELCLYLDEERAHGPVTGVCSNCRLSYQSNRRSDGDGSSSNTNVEPFDCPISECDLRSSFGDQTLLYIRSLERRIRQLEQERSFQNRNIEQHMVDPVSVRPNILVQALKVLEIREKTDREKLGISPTKILEINEGEKALLREMCNVAMRKLEASPNNSMNVI